MRGRSPRTCPRSLREEERPGHHGAADGLLPTAVAHAEASPVALPGHCFLGAPLACEICLRLVAAGYEEPVRHLFVSGARAPFLGNSAKTAGMSDDEFLSGGFPKAPAPAASAADSSRPPSDSPNWPASASGRSRSQPAPTTPPLRGLLTDLRGVATPGTLPQRGHPHSPHGAEGQVAPPHDPPPRTPRARTERRSFFHGDRSEAP
ncbi:thioesterase domain-containing protein [Streptomyces sp. NPDC006134]|uniref:thioesterase domain-containing protein n=1 Tax=Streptomyces sp. NPDC006134 TaxID=3154467 RepID=UPI003408BA6F